MRGLIAGGIGAATWDVKERAAVPTRPPRFLHKSAKTSGGIMKARGRWS
jgi:hypothetical protein